MSNAADDTQNEAPPKEEEQEEKKEMTDEERALAKKKKKNKRKRKKNKAVAGPPAVGSTAMPHGQTFPPTKPIKEIFAGRPMPEGVEQPHWGEDGVRRMGDEELRARARELYGPTLEQLREAAEAHRQVRRYAKSFIVPGVDIADAVARVEKASWGLIGANGLERGWGFPTGVSFNECAAHWTPNPGEHRVVKEDDCIKLDFGVQVGGRIIDSALTLTWTPRYDALLEGVLAATNTGIRHAGVDARLEEIGEAIEETMTSFEVELDGKTHTVKPIENLNGHNIEPYLIHGGKSVPIVRGVKGRGKMEEGEVFAIETFGSTGRGHVVEDGASSHFMRNPEVDDGVRLHGASTVLGFVDRTFGTLPFCRRWLDDLGCPKHLLGLKALCKSGHISAYPPLVDSKGSYTAQYEHTIFIGPSSVEVVSRGEDF